MISLLPSTFTVPAPACACTKRSTSKRRRSPFIPACAQGSGAPAGPGPGPDRGGSGDTDDSWKALQRRVQSVRADAVQRDRRRARNWRTGAYATAVVAVGPIGDYVRRIALDGSLLACGTAKGSVCLFDLPTRQRAVSPSANVGQTTAVCVQGAFLASAGASDQTVCVWDIGAFRKSLQWESVCAGDSSDGLLLPPPLFRLEGHSDIVTSVQIDALGKRLFSASVDGTVCVWDIGDGTPVRTIRVGEPVLGMVVTARNYILVGCVSGRVQAFLADKGLFLLGINCHAANTTALCFHEETQTLATGDSSGHIKLWSFEESKCIGSYPPHTAAVMSIQIDATKVVTASRDGSLAVSAIESKERLFTIAGFTKYISSSVFDDDRLLADGTNNIIACHRFDIK